MKSVGILVFDDVDVLDFAGPFEVFSRTTLDPGVAARRTMKSAPFRVFTIASHDGLVTASGGLRVLPSHTFGDAPTIDILVVPGGFGTRPLLREQRVISWIQARAAKAEYITSVCSGSLLLARCGLLRGRRATTHHGALEELKGVDSTVRVEAGARVVDDGVITSGGVSSGIDMSLHVVEVLFGKDVADDTARYLEYVRRDGGALSSN